MVVYLYSSMAVTCWSRLEVIPPSSREEYLPKKFYTSDRILVRSRYVVGLAALQNQSVCRSIAIELHATTRSLAHYQPISASMVHKHRPVKMAPILMTPGNCFESDGSDANVATIARTATVIWWNPTFPPLSRELKLLSSRLQALHKLKSPSMRFSYVACCDVSGGATREKVYLVTTEAD